MAKSDSSVSDSSVWNVWKFSTIFLIVLIVAIMAVGWNTRQHIVAVEEDMPVAANPVKRELPEGVRPQQIIVDGLQMDYSGSCIVSKVQQVTEEQFLAHYRLPNEAIPVEGQIRYIQPIKLPGLEMWIQYQGGHWVRIKAPQVVSKR